MLQHTHIYPLLYSRSLVIYVTLQHCPANVILPQHLYSHCPPTLGYIPPLSRKLLPFPWDTSLPSNLYSPHNQLTDIPLVTSKNYLITPCFSLATRINVYSLITADLFPPAYIYLPFTGQCYPDHSSLHSSNVHSFL